MGGGKERRMCELIRYLYSLGVYEIHLLSVDDGKSGDIAYPYVLECLKSHQTINRKCSRWQTFKSLYSKINNIKPDIIHDWSGPRVGFYLIPLLVLKKFYYIAGYLADGNKDRLSYAVINKLAFLLSDIVVSNSYAGIKSHKAPKKKSIVIYNGFNLDRIPKVDNEQMLRKEFSLYNKKVVSMVARLTPEKDYTMFLKVAKIINNYRSDIVFFVVGTGPMRNFLENYVTKNNILNVAFLGFRSDVIDILKLSSVSLLCTNNEIHAEGVSNSIMESMACGTPVIATMGGGTPEIIQDGVNGFIVPAHDEIKMANVLLNLIDNEALRDRIIDEGLKTIKSKFSIQKMVSDYESLYRKIEL